jgi:hypothetical protein
MSLGAIPTPALAHHDDFALRMARHSIDNSQVIGRNRRVERREVRPKNLMRRQVRS